GLWLSNCWPTGACQRPPIKCWPVMLGVAVMTAIMVLLINRPVPARECGRCASRCRNAAFVIIAQAVPAHNAKRQECLTPETRLRGLCGSWGGGPVGGGGPPAEPCSRARREPRPPKRRQHRSCARVAFVGQSGIC